MAMSPSVVLRQRRFPSFLAMLAVAVLTVAGCDDSTGNDDSIAAITLNPPTPVLNIGSVQQLVASPTTASGRIIESATVSWISSVPGVATVSNTGLVSAVGGGTTVITATAGDVSATANVTVWGAITAIGLAPAAGSSSTIRQEGSVTIVPTFTVTSGPTTGRQVVWASSNPAVAVVDQGGRVSGLTDGTTNITATALSGGTVGTVAVTVSGAPVVATVTLAPTLGRFMAPGMTDQFVATARAASGTVLSLTGRTVVWTTSAAGVATVTSGPTGGLVSMVATGNSNIRVSVDGIQSAIVVTTGYPQVLSGVELVNPTIASGASLFYVFDVPAGSDTIRVTLGGDTNPAADPDIYVYRPAGTLAGQSFNSGSGELIVLAGATVVAGRWVVEVNAWDGALDSMGARLNVRVINIP